MKFAVKCGRTVLSDAKLAAVSADVGKDNGRWKFLFRFGTVNKRLSRATNPTSLILKAATKKDSNGADVPIPAFDPGVAIIAIPSNRDTYSIGVGIDFVNLLNSWRAKTNSAPANPPPAAPPKN